MWFKPLSIFENMTLLPTWWPKKGGMKTTESPQIGLNTYEQVPWVFRGEIETTGSQVRNDSIPTSNLKLGRKQKIFFLDTIGSLISAGIPLVKGLQLLYFQSKDPQVQKLCYQIKTQIETGRNLAEISRSMPRIFSSFDSAMFEMGDATGKIGHIFETLTEKEEKSLDIERKVKGALIYPLAIVVVAILMVVGLLIFVIPRVETVYREAHTTLPWLTRGVIGISNFLQDHGYIVLIALGLIGAWLQAGMKNEKFRVVIESSLLWLPIFGTLIRLRILAIFSDFLSLLLASGITIHKALAIVSEGMDNRKYQLLVQEIILEIRKWQHLSDSIGWLYLEKKIQGEDVNSPELIDSRKRLEAFWVELATAIKVGEQTGTLANMLWKASLRYSKEIDALVKNLSSLLEPVVIVFVGAIVGVIVMAIMMPFFNMVQVIG
jgi:type IV pilus assembly protein PilC